MEEKKKIRIEPFGDWVVARHKDENWLIPPPYKPNIAVTPFSICLQTFFDVRNESVASATYFKWRNEVNLVKTDIIECGPMHLPEYRKLTWF